jgi:hypothetical protein
MALRDGMWSGSPCVIVGGGPSLRGFDWARAERLCDAGTKCISVNRAAEFLEPDLWLAMDSVYWRKQPARWLPDASGRVTSGAPRVWVDTGDKKPSVDLILPCAAKGVPNPHSALAWGRSLEEGVGCGGNSGFAALNLADILGADPIYLLGFDLKGENGVTANWHDGYTHTKPANESLYDRYLEAFRWAATKVRARVVVLETYQGSSRLDCWEKRLAEEVL